MIKGFLKIIKIVFLITVLHIGSNSSITAQTIDRELGVRLYSLNDFDFIYKKGLSETEFRRYRFALANLGFQRVVDVSTFSFQIGFAIGKEKRKILAQDFLFVHGLEPSLFFNYLDVADNYTATLSPGLGYVIGFQYNVSPKLYVSLETIPALTASFGWDNNGFHDDFAINAGFDANAVAISLVYKFAAERKLSTQR